MAFANVRLRESVYGISIALGETRSTLFLKMLTEYIIYSFISTVCLIIIAPIAEVYMPSNIFPTFDWWVYLLTFAVGIIYSIIICLILSGSVYRKNIVALIKSGN
jgi:ABC-type antimicrobial peptide transport system permease subunit